MDLGIEDLFKEQRNVELQWLKKLKGDQFSLDQEFQKLKEMESRVMEMGKSADPSLVKYVGARSREMEKVLEGIAKKFRKALERNEETSLLRLKKVMEFAFPGGAIQERSLNFLSFFPEDLGKLRGMGDLVDPWKFTVKVVRI